MKKIFVLLAAGLVLGAALCGCRRESASSPGEKDAGVPPPVEAAVPVRTAPVERLETSFPIHTAGTLALKETLKLSFKVGGLVEQIQVDEGQAVSSGQLLARLDLAEIDARAAKARAALDKAARDLERTRLLYEDRVAPLEQLQDAESAYFIARSDMDVAEFNRKHAVIRAPSRGKILKRFASEGELLAPGQPLFVFASTEKSWVLRFGAVDRDVVRLRRGDPAEVRFDVYPEKIFAASVSEIAEAADPASGTFEVELSLAAEEREKLVSGFIARVAVYPTERVLLCFVPLAALVDGEGLLAWVFAVNNETSRVKKLPVALARITDGRAAVRSGLEGIEEVVAGGASYLVDGALVKVVREAE
jgi:multidrug efflux system membrane fusion protein